MSPTVYSQIFEFFISRPLRFCSLFLATVEMAFGVLE